MALVLAGYGPEQSDRDVARLDNVMEKLLDHMKVFEQKKVAAEDIKKVEMYKNCYSAITRGVAVKVECLVASGKTAERRQAMMKEKSKK